ncbi:MAG TPA: hypothetical protein VNN72_18900 [Polyangiaceae bacterium]|nr:hypothetical protein [Polyangiaceae bacterium]
MSRLLPLAFALVTLSACSSDDAPSNETGGAGGTSGTTAAGTGGGGSAGTTGGTSGGGSGGATGGAGAGATGGAAGTAATKDFPADTTAEGIKAFLDAGDYKSATWASSMTAPTEPPPEEISPHGLVQIWYNKALRTSQAAGHSGSMTDPTSMVVKELYSGTSVVGHLAMVRTTDPKWIYYCTSTEMNRCYSGAPANTPVYQTSVTNCACHSSGTIITASKIPPP